eukprot:10248478-Heterocapsa_arctica.AAC.1
MASGDRTTALHIAKELVLELLRPMHDISQVPRCRVERVGVQLALRERVLDGDLHMASQLPDELPKQGGCTTGNAAPRHQSLQGQHRPNNMFTFCCDPFDSYG